MNDEQTAERKLAEGHNRERHDLLERAERLERVEKAIDLLEDGDLVVLAEWLAGISEAGPATRGLLAAEADGLRIAEVEAAIEALEDPARADLRLCLADVRAGEHSLEHLIVEVKEAGKVLQEKRELEQREAQRKAQEKKAGRGRKILTRPKPPGSRGPKVSDEQILEKIAAMPGASATAIGRELGLNQSAISKRMVALEKAGRISSRREGKGNVYEVLEGGARPNEPATAPASPQGDLGASIERAAGESAAAGPAPGDPKPDDLTPGQRELLRTFDSFGTEFVAQEVLLRKAGPRRPGRPSEDSAGDPAADLASLIRLGLLECRRAAGGAPQIRRTT